MDTIKNRLAHIAELQSKVDSIEDKIKFDLQKISDLKSEISDTNFDLQVDVRNKYAESFDAFENAGAEYTYVDAENEDSLREVIEDDGTLHITIGKARGCFICNQDLTRSEWNKEARPIVKQFGFKWSDLNR